MKNERGIFYLLSDGVASIGENQFPYSDFCILHPCECFMLIPKAPGDWDCD